MLFQELFFFRIYFKTKKIIAAQNKIITICQIANE